jgi:hypothetical protein
MISFAAPIFRSKSPPQGVRPGLLESDLYSEGPHSNHGPNNKCVITYTYRHIQKEGKKKSPSAVKSKKAGYCFGNFDKGCDSVPGLDRLGAAREER